MTTKRGLAPKGATPIERALRRVRDASPLLRRLAAWSPVGRLLSVILLARLVRESIRFAARELGSSAAPAQYTLRESGLRVWLRHGTPDVQNFDEIFYQRLYAMPDAVTGALPIGRPLTVVDLGANIGLAGAFFIGSASAARVVGFEPDPTNAEIHDLAIRSNRLGDRWTVVRACAWVETDELRFLAGGFAESRLATDEEAGILVPAVDVFPYLDGADLVKMDVEGSEWQILSDQRFDRAGIPALVLEYHALLCPAPEPEVYVKDLLHQAGYETQPIFHDPDGIGMLWAWRTP